MDERRLGLLFAGAPRVPEMVALARRAEEHGFESVWVAETRMTRDGFVPLAAIAQATSRVKVGTGIVNVYTRGAVVVAISFAALEEIAPGRVIMGLGAGSPLVLAPQGVAWKKPVTRLREYCDVVRPLLRGEEVAYEGEFVHLEGAQIQDLLAADASHREGRDAARPRSHRPSGGRARRRGRRRGPLQRLPAHGVPRAGARLARGRRRALWPRRRRRSTSGWGS